MTWSSVLAASAGPDDQSLAVATSTYGLRLGSTCTIEDEIVQVRGYDAGRIYVVRGYGGTDPASHAAGTAVGRWQPTAAATSNASAPQFPVGHILISADNVNPATWLGYGTWAQWGQGRLVLGATAAGEALAGSATHAHTFTQPSDHAALTHTGTGVANHVVTQPGAHSDHTALTHTAHSGTAVANHTFTQPAGHSAHVVTQPANHTFTQPGAHSAHVFTQPTAANESAHTHGAGTLADATSGSTVKLFTASASGVSAATHSGSTGTGVAHTHTLTGGAIDAHSAHAGGAVDAHSATAVDAHSAHSGGAVDAHAVTQPGAHTDHGVSSHSAHSGAAVDAHAVTQPGQHAAVSHVGGVVADGTNDPLSITAFLFKRTA